MIIETVSVGAMQVNCYVVAENEGGEALIIDPGDQEKKIRRALEKHALRPACIVNTHGHYDHIGCDDCFGVPVYVHGEDAACLTDPLKNLSGFFASPYVVKSPIRILSEKDVVKLGNLEFKVIHLPGHTPGGIGLLLVDAQRTIVFTGDTLFNRGIGRSDLSGGNGEELIRSLREKLFVLPDDTIVYPGHGASTTIGEEKKENPFVAEEGV